MSENKPRTWTLAAAAWVPIGRLVAYTEEMHYPDWSPEKIQVVEMSAYKALQDRVDELEKLQPAVPSNGIIEKASILTQPMLRSMISRTRAYEACIAMADWVNSQNPKNTVPSESEINKALSVIQDMAVQQGVRHLIPPCDELISVVNWLKGLHKSKDL